MSKLNWSIWLRMPSLTENQAVALSLGTDPNNLPWNFKAANRDRLTLFNACHKIQITPANLAQWAQSVQWNIPMELAALAPITPVELLPLHTDAVIQALSEIAAPGVAPEMLLSEVLKSGVKFISDNGESIAVIPNGTVMGRRVGLEYLSGSLPNHVAHLVRASGASGSGAVQSVASNPPHQVPAPGSAQAPRATTDGTGAPGDAILPPAVPSGAGGTVLEEADEKWKQTARQRAAEIIKRQRDNDLYPSQTDIADEIAKEFRKTGINGPDGKPLSGATIKRHALKGISSAQGKQVSTSIARGK